MLAYLFWHRPRGEIDAQDYERLLWLFHEKLANGGSSSAAFRLSALPFTDGPGYEDWYLVEDWTALGALNEVAIGAKVRETHDAVAELAGEGWGGVYRLLRGQAIPPRRARWVNKPGDQSYDVFLDQLRDMAVWQRQLVLGPAPEFCLGDDRAPDRHCLWPPLARER
jgi:hypothetical protein